MKSRRWFNLLMGIMLIFALVIPASALTATVQSDSSTQWSADGINYDDSMECFEHIAWNDNGIDDVSWIWQPQMSVGGVINPNWEYDNTPVGGWYFQKTFELPVDATNITATLTSNCDNGYIVYINGTWILAQGSMDIEGPDAQDYKSLETNVITNLVPGTNTILIRATNYFSSAEGSKTGDAMYGNGTTNPAGLIYKLDVNYDLAERYSICGFKYNDDTGEPMEGWVIFLLNEDTGETWETETDANGLYCFDDLLAGDYEVTEEAVDGWMTMYPEGGSHYVTLPNETMIYGIQRYTGKIFEVNPLAPLSATLYQQIDASLLNKAFSSTSPNGIAFDQETGDIYFATYPGTSKLYKFEDGVQRELGTLIGSVASGEIYNGKYYYIADATDDLYVVSFKEDGTIDTIEPHLNISGGASAWYFGDIVVDHAEGVIYGEGQSGQQQFFKVNLDGSGYQLIKSFSGNLLQLAIGTDNVIYAHSAFNGDFYTIDRTTGLPIPVAYGDNQYTDISSASMCYYNFRNAQTYSICGYKYGVGFDNTECTDKPLEGWTMTLLDADGEELDRTTTDENGKYCFTNLMPGEYTVVESYGVMNSSGFWKFNNAYWKPYNTDGSITVTLPADASDCEDGPFFNFFNLCYSNQTAWAFGDVEHNSLLGMSNNWGWSINLGILAGTEEDTLLAEQPIYAGAGQNDVTKGYLVGYVRIYWRDGKITPEYDFDPDMVFAGVPHVYIGNTEIQLDKKGNFTNAPGQLKIATVIDYTKNTYIAIHFDTYVPCGFPHATDPVPES